MLPSTKYNVNISDTSGVVVGDRAKVVQKIAAVYNLHTDDDSLTNLAPLLDRLRPILARHEIFAGRDEILAKLDEFRTSRTGYLFLAGPSGFGKTAVLSNWLKSLQASNVPVCYHFISRYDGLADEEFALSNLCQQLASLHGLVGKLPASASMLRALYVKLLTTPLPDNRRVVVIIDAIDEASGWRVGPELFPKRLPETIGVVFSARDVADQDWPRDLELPADSVVGMRLGRLNPVDIGRMLRVSLDSAESPFDAHDEFILELFNKSEGDPLYLHYLIDEIVSVPNGAVLDLTALPEGLERYFDRWWNDVSQEAVSPAVRDLLGYLLVAKGPLERAELIDVSETDALDGWSFDNAREAVRRYVIGTDQSGYAIGNRRFHEYLTRKRIGPKEQAPYLRRLMEYCQDWQSRRSTYVVHHFSEHLRDGNQIEQLLELLQNAEWFSQQIANDPTARRFLTDIESAWELVEDSGASIDDSLDLRAQALSREVYFAATSCTVRSFTTNLPPKLVGLMVGTGIWSMDEALSIVPDIAEAEERVGLVTTLIPFANGVELEKLLAQLLKAPIRDDRVEGIAAVAARLQPLRRQELLESELVRISESGRVSDQVVRSAILMPLLGEDRRKDLLRTALETAARIESPSRRIFALSALIDIATGEQRVQLKKRISEDALSLASPHSWADFLQHLPDEEQSEFVDAMWHSVAPASADGPNHIDGLLSVLPILHGNLFSYALDEVLDAASRTASDGSRSEILKAAATVMPPDTVDRAIGIAAALQSSSNRIFVMGEIIRCAEADQQPQLAWQLLSEARETGDRDAWIYALTGAFQFLDNNERIDAANLALDATHYIFDGHAFGKAFCWLAPLIDVSSRIATIEFALEKAREAGDLQLQAKLIAHVASLLPEDEVVDLSRGVIDKALALIEEREESSTDRSGGAVTVNSQLAELMQSLQWDATLESIVKALAEVPNFQSFLADATVHEVLIPLTDSIRLPGNRARALAAVVSLMGVDLWKIVLPSAIALDGDEQRADLVRAAAAVGPLPNTESITARQLIERMESDLFRVVVKLELIDVYEGAARLGVIEEALSVVHEPDEAKEESRSGESEEIDFSEAKLMSVGSDDDRGSSMNTSPRAEVLLALCRATKRNGQIGAGGDVCKEIDLACKALTSPTDRVQVWGELLPLLKGDRFRSVQESLLRSAEEIEDPVARVLAVRWGDLDLDFQDRYRCWTDLLHHLSVRSRSEFLTAMEGIAPLLFKLGGEDACGRAAANLVAIARRWP